MIDSAASARSMVGMDNATPEPDRRRALETMTTTEVAAFLGLGSAAAARVQLSRWGVESVGRTTEVGEKQWPAAEIVALHRSRPGSSNSR